MTRKSGRKPPKPAPESSRAPPPRTVRRTKRSSGAHKDGDNSVGYGSLTKDPVPRRSAPVQSSGDSVASLGSRIRSQSDLDEDEDKDRDNEEPAQDTFSAADEERWQIMESLLPDFTRATDDLKHLLESGSYGNKVFAVILDTKRRVFRSLLEHYEEAEQSESSFIDPEWLKRLRRRGEPDTKMSNALVCANIVNALDGIECLDQAKITETTSFLEDLDSCFAHVFAPPGTWVDHWELALDLRTCYLIEVLSARRGQYDVKEAIASVFCEATDNEDYAKLLENGPFKALTSRNDTETSKEQDVMISTRTELLYAFSRADKKNHGLGRMRKTFPRDKILQELKQLFLDLYTASKDTEGGHRAGLNEQTETRRESRVDAEETIPDSISESQPIVRPTKGDVTRSTLFKGKASLHILQSTTIGQIDLLPYNYQQHNKGLSITPTDYQDDATKLLRQDNSRGSDQINKRKRACHLMTHIKSDEDDDVDDDAFEVDTRYVPCSRLAQVKAHSAAQAARHQDLPINPSSREMTPRPVPTQPDYDAMKHRKIEIFEAARSRILNSSKLLSTSSPSTSYPLLRQRHLWTNDDSTLLIKLVGEKHAAWSDIAKEHNHEFQHPRNQQAYRDKARNMKVDFLLLDMVLPLGFDYVALGKKEVEKLLSQGKNPYRKESEIDDDGKAINTDLRNAAG